MVKDAEKNLTYVLSSGEEKTVLLSPEKLVEFLKWFSDSNSSNIYDVTEGISEHTTFYKNILLSVKY